MIKKILVNTIVVFLVLMIQHIVLFLFSKVKDKPKLKENFITVFSASVFIGIMFSLISVISSQFNYKIIPFILFASVISSYWFIINPLKYIFLNKKYHRDTELEEEFKLEGYNYKILFTNKISTNAYATGIIPFYKIIIVGENLKENLNKQQLKAIIYHEIGHHENKHILKLFFINVLLQTLFFLVFFQVHKLHFSYSIVEPLLVALTGAIVGLTFWVVPNKISYILEYQADNYSAKNYNKKAIIEALKKMDEISGGKLTKGNISHPNLEKRLKNIER
jgi:Zn-dependent protease with chaperone function